MNLPNSNDCSATQNLPQVIAVSVPTFANLACQWHLFSSSLTLQTAHLHLKAFHQIQLFRAWLGFLGQTKGGWAIVTLSPFRVGEQLCTAEQFRHRCAFRQ